MRKRILSGLLAGVMCFSITVSASAAELSVPEEELAAACSAGWGYKDLELRSNPEGRQGLYNKFMEIYSDFWFSDEDLTLDDWLGCYVVGEISLNDYGLTNEEAIEVYYTFRNDNPLFYYASSGTMYYWIDYGYRQDNYFVVTTDDDYAAAADRKVCQEKIKDYLAEKGEGIAGMTRNYEIAKYFHDELCRDAEYAYVEENGDLYADPSVKAHNILGIITEGRGVCESYAKLYELLLTYAGVSNVYVVGDTDEDGQTDHAWNVVQMDNNKFYNFDVTWDDQYIIFYNYFARGTEFFYDEHTPDSSEGTGNSFLYDLPEIPEEDYDPDDIAGPIIGDLTGDGDVNMKDLAMLQRILNGTDLGISDEAADVNGDVKLNMKDYIFLQRLINGYTE